MVQSRDNGTHACNKYRIDGCRITADNGWNGSKLEMKIDGVIWSCLYVKRTSIEHSQWVRKHILAPHEPPSLWISVAALSHVVPVLLLSNGMKILATKAKSYLDNLPHSAQAPPPPAGPIYQLLNKDLVVILNHVVCTAQRSKFTCLSSLLQELEICVISYSAGIGAQEKL